MTMRVGGRTQRNNNISMFMVPQCTYHTYPIITCHDVLGTTMLHCGCCGTKAKKQNCVRPGKFRMARRKDVETIMIPL